MNGISIKRIFTAGWMRYDTSRPVDLDRCDKEFADWWGGDEILVTQSKAIEALRLHVAFEAVPADRGGPNGPKGRAWAAFIKARDEALA